MNDWVWLQSRKCYLWTQSFIWFSHDIKTSSFEFLVQPIKYIYIDKSHSLFQDQNVVSHICPVGCSWWETGLSQAQTVGVRQNRLQTCHSPAPSMCPGPMTEDGAGCPPSAASMNSIPNPELTQTRQKGETTEEVVKSLWILPAWARGREKGSDEPGEMRKEVKETPHICRGRKPTRLTLWQDKEAASLSLPRPFFLRQLRKCNFIRLTGSLWQSHSFWSLPAR